MALVKNNSSKAQIIFLSSILGVLIVVMAFTYWWAESQAKIEGLALNEQGEVTQGLHVVVFKGNSQIGSILSFANESLEGHSPSAQSLAAEENNFELKFLDKYGFPARAEYIGAIQANGSTYIPSPSGQTLQIVVVRDLGQIASIIPNATSGPEPESPAIVKILEYIISLGPLGAISIIVIIIFASVVIGIFKKINATIADRVIKPFVASAKFGAVEFADKETGKLIVSFAEKAKAEKGTRLLIRGETIDKRSSKVARPIIGTATIYRLLENNRYWALIDKVHQRAERGAKFKITKGCEVEIYRMNDEAPQFDLVYLNLGDKGRVYKIEKDKIFVNIGSEYGVKKGMVLEAVEPQIDLDGEYLGDDPIVKLRVLECEAKFSKCSIFDGKKVIHLDTLVRIKKT